MSYSTKCFLDELRLGKMSLDELSFRRNAFRRNVMDPVLYTLIINLLFKGHYVNLQMSKLWTKLANFLILAYVFRSFV